MCSFSITLIPVIILSLLCTIVYAIYFYVTQIKVKEKKKTVNAIEISNQKISPNNIGCWIQTDIKYSQDNFYQKINDKKNITNETSPLLTYEELVRNLTIQQKPTTTNEIFQYNNEKNTFIVEAIPVEKLTHNFTVLQRPTIPNETIQYNDEKNTFIVDAIPVGNPTHNFTVQQRPAMPNETIHYNDEKTTFIVDAIPLEIQAHNITIQQRPVIPNETFQYMDEKTSFILDTLPVEK